MLYKVKTTCYWHNRYYEKGEEVELEEQDVPEHFTRVLSIAEKLEELKKQQSPAAVDTKAETDCVDASGVASYSEGHKEPEKPDAAENSNAEQAEAKPLDKMTNFELRALAKKNGIEFSKNVTNTELIAAIRGE